MKPLKALALTAIAAAIAAPVAAQELSFNIGVVSLYKSSGIDQDMRAAKSFRPALQGGVDYDFGNGFYVGNWNSTGKFGENSGADLEIDLYAGYAGQINDDLGFDVGVQRFVYPSDNTWNANEWYASLSYGIVTAKYTRGFSNGNKNARLGLSIEQPLNEQMTLTAGVGFRNNVNLGGAYDYNIGVSYDLGNDLSASAAISAAEKTADVGEAGKARLVVGISKSF